MIHRVHQTKTNDQCNRHAINMMFDDKVTQWHLYQLHKSSIKKNYIQLELHLMLKFKRAIIAVSSSDYFMYLIDWCDWYSGRLVCVGIRFVVHNFPINSLKCRHYMMMWCARARARKTKSNDKAKMIQGVFLVRRI